MYNLSINKKNNYYRGYQNEAIYVYYYINLKWHKTAEIYALVSNQEK